MTLAAEAAASPAPRRRPQRARLAGDRPPALNARLDAIASTLGPDKTAMRAAAVTEFRTALESGRHVLREWLEEDGKGYECVVHMSWLEDELIRAIHRFVTHHMYPADNPSSGERIAIAATGGYGRGTLAPGSDIDLLFLLPYKKTAVERERHRGDSLLPVGPAPEGRPCHALGRRMPAPGARRHDDPHLASGGALHPGRRDAVRRHAHALRRRSRAQDRGRIRVRQARRTRRARRARRRLALSRRAQHQGRQGRPARSQHAVLDFQVRLPRARCRRAGEGRPVHRSGVPHVPQVRGIPLDGALRTCTSSPVAPKSASPSITSARSRSFWATSRTAACPTSSAS